MDFRREQRQTKIEKEGRHQNLQFDVSGVQKIVNMTYKEFRSWKIHEIDVEQKQIINMAYKEFKSQKVHENDAKKYEYHLIGGLENETNQVTYV